jgi:isopropylmalate/homocitrate/citramalate synthase
LSSFKTFDIGGEQAKLHISCLGINDLINAGLKSIEVGSCVSAKWVPQMAQSDELFKLL